jgi:hypothetical protein
MHCWRQTVYRTQRFFVPKSCVHQASKQLLCHHPTLLGHVIQLDICGFRTHIYLTWPSLQSWWLQHSLEHRIRAVPSAEVSLLRRKQLKPYFAFNISRHFSFQVKQGINLQLHQQKTYFHKQMDFFKNSHKNSSWVWNL